MIRLDGPLGTELAARGVDTALPKWSAGAIEEAPEVVRAIHAEYAEAGARVHTANTFRTRERTVGRRWAELAVRAVTLCREAVPADHEVAGSLAPLEDCYRPDLSPPEPRAEHRALAEVLAAAGCDRLLCETFPHVGELVVAVEEAVRTGRPTWAALTAGPSADLMTPEAMAEGARRAVDAGAEAVLVNCVPAVATLRYVRALAAADLGVPIGAYANAGAVDDRIGWRASPEPGPTRYAALARTWREAGATILGGCCGTGPAHVRALTAVR